MPRFSLIKINPSRWSWSFFFQTNLQACVCVCERRCIITQLYWCGIVSVWEAPNSTERSRHRCFCLLATSDWHPAIKKTINSSRLLVLRRGSGQLAEMKINSQGDRARHLLLFSGICIGFKTVRLNHSHERCEHTPSGTKLAYSWGQRCRTESQQFKDHTGIFFFFFFEIKMGKYTFDQQKWDFRAFITVFGGTWISQRRCRTITELMKQSTTGPSAEARARVRLHSRTQQTQNCSL